MLYKLYAASSIIGRNKSYDALLTGEAHSATEPSNQGGNIKVWSKVFRWYRALFKVGEAVGNAMTNRSYTRVVRYVKKGARKMKLKAVRDLLKPMEPEASNRGVKSRW